MDTATPRQRMESCRAFQDVTGNGVVFDWNLEGPRGQRFTLFREAHHTDGDLCAAQAWLRQHCDVVGIAICDVEKAETHSLAARPTVTVAIFESECGTHARVFQQSERASAWRLELARRGWRREFANEPLPDEQELPPSLLRSHGAPGNIRGARVHIGGRMNPSNRSAGAAALSGPLGDEEAMMQALFGRFARRVPMWRVMQETGNVGVTFVGASRDLRLRFGSTMTHQLILGEMIVRPHVAIESNHYQGLGLSGFLTQCADLEEWFARGQLLCDPIGRFAPAGRPR